MTAVFVDRMIELPGATIRYVADGPPDGTVVLFSHGFGSSSHMWLPQVSALAAAGYRTAAWDIRGHGQSTAGEDSGGYTTAASLADISAVLDDLGAATAVLGGASLGGYLTQLYRLANPERVTAMILLGTGPGFRNDDARANWNDMAERFASSYERKGLDGLPSSSELDAAVHVNGSGGLVLAARGILQQHDSTVIDSLASITIPTLVLVGDGDKPYLHTAEYVAGKIPGAEHHVIAAAGHAANLDQPEVVNKHIVDFLSRLP
jgi:pimeloyl-ACP methyl ester carboxylesterase